MKNIAYLNVFHVLMGLKDCFRNFDLLHMLKDAHFLEKSKTLEWQGFSSILLCIKENYYCWRFSTEEF